MSLRNSRERPEQVARLARLLESADLAEVGHAIRYLLAQLKVNFRPLYTETIKAFSLLKRGDEIWESVWAELEKTHHATVFAVPDLGVFVPAWTEVTARSSDAPDDEEEPEFRCTGLDKSKRIIDKEWQGVSDEASLDADDIKVSRP